MYDKMIINSFYESKNDFGRLIKRESSCKKDIRTAKKMSFIGKYIAEMFSLKNILINEFIAFVTFDRGFKMNFAIMMSLMF